MDIIEELLAHAWWALILGAIVLAFLCYRYRYALLIRLPLWLITHTLYRLRTQGLEHLPTQGAALLVSNHVSYLDALMIMASQKRRIRFLVWTPYFRIPFIHLFMKIADVIPINGQSGPRELIKSMREAGEALKRGEIVCIFAEGSMSRTGFLLPFQRGFEQIVKRSPTPILPVCVDHAWGSIFSYCGKRFFWKWPRELPYPISVSFGAALPADTDAFEVRQTIAKMLADSGIRRALERKPMHRVFVRQAVRRPWNLCLIDPSAPRPCISYGMALAITKMFCRRLRPILSDDRMVGVWLPPGAGSAVSNIALSCLGKVTVNLNYSSSPAIVQSSLRQCGIRHVLTSRLFTHKIPLDPGPGVELIYIEDFRKLIGNFERICTLLGVYLLPGFLHEYWLMGLGKHRANDLATVIFSSGSTGDPKGVMLTHANVAANAESVIQAIDPTPADRLFGILPFFHSFGYTVTLWLPLQVGASTLYHVNPLQAREIGELCRTHGCTIFLSTPTFLRSYLKRCEPNDFKSLRILICGAEKMSQSLAQEFKEKFGIAPLEGYGCTELSPVAAVNVPDWAHGQHHQQGNKPGTIGQPIPNVAARIVDRSTGMPLPPNQEGLLQIYGANVMRGYLGRDDLTREKIVDGGWYVTGDLALIDEEGFITITGRLERFAKVGGEMVPLEKVDEELHNILHSNERLLAVTAVPDPRKGERLVVLHLALLEMTPQQLWQQLNERGLPNIYVPGQRDFFLVPDLPILGSGKLDLKRLKEKALELTGNG